MKRYRTLLIITLILFVVGIPVLLSAAERLKITPPGEFNLQAREMQAPLAIKNKLQALRAQIAAEKLTFEVGYTAAMDFDLAKLAALKAPADLNQKIKAQNALALVRLRALPVAAAICSAAAPSFDWRKGGGSTPVKDQGACGSCWDFATCGAFEGSYRKISNVTLNVSEQDILDCNSHGYSCAGGWWAFDDLINTGKKSVADEATYPYTHVKGACKSVARPYKADTWGYVGSSSSIPSVAALKQALCTHGPLAVAVQATSAFQAYTGGVFSQSNISGVNHGVTLYGWDDSKGAWLIKNSWGTGWGSTCEYGTERGFMWIKYGSNNIGYAAAWTRAHAPLPAPKQIAPPNGSTFSNYPRTTTLKWQAVPGATKYTVQIDCLHCCVSGKWCTDVGREYKLVPNVAATQYTFNFVGAQPGRWRVWAIDGTGAPGPKSGWWEFKYTK